MRLGDIGKLAPEIDAWYFIYRLVLKKLASVHELKTCITYPEALHLNALLDMQEDIKTAAGGYKEK